MLFFSEDEIKLEEICKEAFTRILNPRVRIFDEASQRYVCGDAQEKTTFNELLEEAIRNMQRNSEELRNCYLFDWHQETESFDDLLDRYRAEINERLAFLQTVYATSLQEV